MGKIAIYTCIIHGYDTLKQPSCPPPPGIDFICFVAQGESQGPRDGVWEIRELSGLGIEDPQILSRYPKMHPHLLLPDYESSLWIDGNLQICSSELYAILPKRYAEGTIYAGVPHPTRDCPYREARVCQTMGLISPLTLLKVWLFLFFHGIRPHSGLLENNLIYRRHCDIHIVTLDELWWRELQTLCRRDQLSLSYCLKRSGVHPVELLPNHQNSRTFGGLKYLPHK